MKSQTEDLDYSPDLPESKIFIKIQYFSHKTIADSQYYCIRSKLEGNTQYNNTRQRCCHTVVTDKKLYFQLFRILWTVSGVNSNDKDLHLCVTLFFLKRQMEKHKKETQKTLEKNRGPNKKMLEPRSKQCLLSFIQQ